MTEIKFYYFDDDKNICTILLSELTEEIAKLRGKNCHIAKTEFEDGSYLSTVLLPIAFGDLIFETIHFDTISNEDYCKRYKTQEEAIAGHEAFVEGYRKLSEEK
jgi:hypothetical protein